MKRIFTATVQEEISICNEVHLVTNIMPQVVNDVDDFDESCLAAAKHIAESNSHRKIESVVLGAVRDYSCTFTLWTNLNKRYTIDKLKD